MGFYDDYGSDNSKPRNEGRLFCRYCQTDVTDVLDIFCPKCGGKIHKDDVGMK